MKLLRLLEHLLPHLLLILSLMLLTFFFIDLVNESMAFLNNRITKILCAVHALLCAVFCILAVVKGKK